MPTLSEALKSIGVEEHVTLTYQQYCDLIQIAVPHGPDEPCTCEGCPACKGKVYGCTCDVDWDLAREVRDLWYG